MATKQPITSHPKLAKTEVKRSAPTPQQSLHSRQHPIVGTAMLALMKDAISARQEMIKRDAFLREVLDHDEDIAALAASMAFVPPSTPEEALAAVCMICADAEGIEDDGAKPDVRRIRQRAHGLAAWIETRFGLDRHDHGLNHFCDERLTHGLLPSSPPHPTVESALHRSMQESTQN